MREWLRTARVKKGFTQADVGNRVGVCESVIGKYENGKRTPTVPVAQSIAKVLGFKWTKFYES